MSLQPPEYWLDMYNIELELKMAEAERRRRRSETGVRPPRRAGHWRSRLAGLFVRPAAPSARPAAPGRATRLAAVDLSPCPE